MEGNDIGITYVARYAVKFEGLLMHEVLPPEKKGVKKLIDRFAPSPLSDKTATRYWRPNDMPMKSLLHLLNKLHIEVEVITYMPPEYEEIIETWLARKGAFVECTSYPDTWEWAEDLRRNPEFKGYYTDDPLERDIIGFQHVTVVRPSSTWGF